MIYDVKRKTEALKDLLPAIEELIDKDEVDSLAIIIRKRNGDVHMANFFGEAGIFEWIGISEILKKRFLDASEGCEDDEDDFDDPS